jgi:hypothetical protein
LGNPGSNYFGIARRGAYARLGGGNGNGMGLSERHEYPHLLVSDMAARHERSSAKKITQ